MIDVIVTNLNRPKATKLTIEALLRANDDIRVILINNYFVYKPDIETDRLVIKNLSENLGQAGAVNIGLEMSKTEYVVFMHNDIIINDKNWISKAADFLKENKEAGLVDTYGWKVVDGKVRNITSLRGHEKQKVKELTHDFEEVLRTDSFSSIFKNDGIRADERYCRTCCGIWIDILSRGLKLYVMKLEDGIHLKDKEKYIALDSKGNKKLQQRLKRYYKNQRRNVRLTKLAEKGVECII